MTNDIIMNYLNEEWSKLQKELEETFQKKFEEEVKKEAKLIKKYTVEQIKTDKARETGIIGRHEYLSGDMLKSITLTQDDKVGLEESIKSQIKTYSDNLKKDYLKSLEVKKENFYKTMPKVIAQKPEIQKKMAKIQQEEEKARIEREKQNAEITLRQEQETARKRMEVEAKYERARKKNLERKAQNMAMFFQKSDESKSLTGYDAQTQHKIENSKKKQSAVNWANYYKDEFYQPKSFFQTQAKKNEQAKKFAYYNQNLDLTDKGMIETAKKEKNKKQAENWANYQKDNTFISAEAKKNQEKREEQEKRKRKLQQQKEESTQYYKNLDKKIGKAINGENEDGYHLTMKARRKLNQETKYNRTVKKGEIYTDWNTIQQAGKSLRMGNAVLQSGKEAGKTIESVGLYGKGLAKRGLEGKTLSSLNKTYEEMLSKGMEKEAQGLLDSINTAIKNGTGYAKEKLVNQLFGTSEYGDNVSVHEDMGYYKEGSLFNKLRTNFNNETPHWSYGADETKSYDKALPDEQAEKDEETLIKDYNKSAAEYRKNFNDMIQSLNNSELEELMKTDPSKAIATITECLGAINDLGHSLDKDNSTINLEDVMETSTLSNERVFHSPYLDDKDIPQAIEKSDKINMLEAPEIAKKQLLGRIDFLSKNAGGAVRKNLMSVAKGVENYALPREFTENAGNEEQVLSNFFSSLMNYGNMIDNAAERRTKNLGQEANEENINKQRELILNTDDSISQKYNLSKDLMNVVDLKGFETIDKSIGAMLDFDFSKYNLGEDETAKILNAQKTLSQMVNEEIGLMKTTLGDGTIIQEDAYERFASHFYQNNMVGERSPNKGASKYWDKSAYTGLEIDRDTYWDTSPAERTANYYKAGELTSIYGAPENQKRIYDEEGNIVQEFKSNIDLALENAKKMLIKNLGNSFLGDNFSEDDITNEVKTIKNDIETLEKLKKAREASTSKDIAKDSDYIIGNTMAMLKSKKSGKKTLSSDEKALKFVDTMDALPSEGKEKLRTAFVKEYGEDVLKNTYSHAEKYRTKKIEEEKNKEKEERKNKEVQDLTEKGLNPDAVTEMQKKDAERNKKIQQEAKKASDAIKEESKAVENLETNIENLNKTKEEKTAIDIENNDIMFNAINYLNEEGKKHIQNTNAIEAEKRNVEQITSKKQEEKKAEEKLIETKAEAEQAIKKSSMSIKAIPVQKDADFKNTHKYYEVGDEKLTALPTATGIISGLYGSSDFGVKTNQMKKALKEFQGGVVSSGADLGIDKEDEFNRFRNNYVKTERGTVAHKAIEVLEKINKAEQERADKLGKEYLKITALSNLTDEQLNLYSDLVLEYQEDYQETKTGMQKLGYSDEDIDKNIGSGIDRRTNQYFGLMDKFGMGNAVLSETPLGAEINGYKFAGTFDQIFNSVDDNFASQIVDIKNTSDVDGVKEAIQLTLQKLLLRANQEDVLNGTSSLPQEVQDVLKGMDFTNAQTHIAHLAENGNASLIDFDDLSDEKIFELLMKYKNGETLTDNDKNDIRKNRHFANNTVLSKTQVDEFAREHNPNFIEEPENNFDGLSESLQKLLKEYQAVIEKQKIFRKNVEDAGETGLSGEEYIANAENMTRMSKLNTQINGIITNKKTSSPEEQSEFEKQANALKKQAYASYGSSVNSKVTLSGYKGALSDQTKQYAKLVSAKAQEAAIQEKIDNLTKDDADKNKNVISTLEDKLTKTKELVAQEEKMQMLLDNRVKAYETDEIAKMSSKDKSMATSMKTEADKGRIFAEQQGIDMATQAMSKASGTDFTKGLKALKEYEKLRDGAEVKMASTQRQLSDNTVSNSQKSALKQTLKTQQELSAVIAKRRAYLDEEGLHYTDMAGIVRTLTLDEEQRNTVMTAQSEQAAKQAEAMQKAQTATLKSQNLFTQIMGGFRNSFRNLIDYTLAYQVVDTVKQKIRELIQTTKELDTVMVDLQIVTQQSRQETMQLMNSYNQLATELGRTTAEVATASNDWLRAGYAGEEAAQLTKASMYLSTLGMIESSTATNNLISSLKGWKLETNEVMNVVDKLVEVDMNAATSAGDLANAMSRANNSARLAGSDMNKFIGYVTTIAEVTQKSAESVGES